MYSSGTTGNPKQLVYSEEMMQQLSRQMDMIVEKVGFKDEGEIVNTYSFFPSHAPNLGFWQGTQIGKFSWAKHWDIGGLLTMGLEGLKKVLCLLKNNKKCRFCI